MGAAGFIDVDAGEGLRLRVRRTGTGAPLLLLHGFTGSLATWAFLEPALRDRHQLIAVDLPGHGGSSAPADPARYALPRLADDLALVLGTLGLSRVALLGYSLGGRAALHFTVRHPNRVAALILESASYGITKTTERDARRASDAALAAEIERDGVAAFVDRWEKLPLWHSQARLPRDVRDALRARRLDNSPAGLANSLRGAGAGAAAPLLDEISRIEAPVLLIAGALDRKYVELARAMQRSLPRARLEIVAGAGHSVHLEQPAAFVQLISAFLPAAPTE